MLQPEVHKLKTALSALNGEKPPAPFDLIRGISNLDFDLIHDHMPELLSDLVLRITADAIFAFYDLIGPKKVKYWHSLDRISKKLNSIARGQDSRSELAVYLRKLDDQLAEFGL